MKTADITAVRDRLLSQFDSLDDKASILRAPELRELFGAIKDQPQDERQAFGAAVNALKEELQTKVADA